MKKPLAQCRLYAFIDEAYRGDRSYRELALALCEGGADVLQLRMKGCPEASLLKAAESIVAITESAGVHLVINDAIAIAHGLPSPFLHLGQEDFFDAGYRHVKELNVKDRPFQGQVGLSTHAPEQALRAVQAGADYLGVGPVFATPTKPTAKPVRLEYVRWAADNIQIPWFAIGGIKKDNVNAVLDAGARRICVVSDILADASPSKACEMYCRLLDQYPF